MIKCVAVFLAALSASVAFALADGELRTWTDSTGNFKVEARFVSQEKDKVTLKDKDGKLFEIETKKLSAADQKHLAELAKMLPMPEDPFKPVGSGKTVSPDWSGSREIEVTAPVEWKGVAFGKLDEATFKSALVPLAPRLNFFEGCSALVVNPASRRAIVGYQWGGKSARITYCDLEAGKTLNQTTIPTTDTVTPIALSDDGTQAAFKRTTDGKDTLELWTMSEKGNEKIADFSAANASVKSKGRAKGHDIRWAEFLDKKRLLTASYSGGLVVMWELPSLKPLYHVITRGESVPALSADRKQLAFVTGKELAVLDVDAGKVIATRPTPQQQPWASLAISPGGKWIACGSHNHVYIWNAATGELHRDHTVEPLDVWGYVNWANDDTLFLGNKGLMDVDLGYRFWDFKGHNHVHVHGNQAWFVTHQNGSRVGAILPTALPTAAVQAAFDKAKSADIVLKPGTTVKVDVRSLPDPEERVKAAKALEDQLVKKGFKVADDADLELIASADTGKIVELNFVPGSNDNRPWMPTPPRLPGSAPPRLPPGTKVRTVKMEEHFSHLKFVAVGRTVWQAKGDNLPKRVQLEEGETLDQHVKKLERPNYDFYKTVDLPRVLHRTAGAAPLGTSTVTVAGVK